MNINPFISRIKLLITEPQKEFVKISTENNTPKALFIRFVLPLILIDALASYIGRILFGNVTLTDGNSVVLTNMLLILISQLIGYYLSAYALTEIFKLFKQKIDIKKSFTIVSYAATPVYLAMILGGLIPRMSELINLFALFSIVLFWYATNTLTDITKDKNYICTPISIAVIITIYLVVRLTLGAIIVA